jgi:hypothetical protein
VNYFWSVVPSQTNDYFTASISTELGHIAMNMLVLGKRNQISCSSLLADLAGRTTRPEPPRSAGVPIPNIGNGFYILSSSIIDMICRAEDPITAKFQHVARNRLLPIGPNFETLESMERGLGGAGASG